MATTIISILNLKGGVGKTTTTINLGKALALKKKKVLLIDSDPQANLTEGLGISQPDRTLFNAYKEESTVPIVKIDKYLHIVPSELNLATIEHEVEGNINRYYLLKDGLKEVAEKYQYIIIDCPPSIGVYTINGITASTHYLITAQAARYSITGLNSIKDLIDNKIRQRLNPEIQPLGILITGLTKTIAADISIEEIQDDYENELFESKIRQTTKFVESQLAGEDIFTYAPNSKGAYDYEKLAKEVIKRLKS